MTLTQNAVFTPDCTVPVVGPTITYDAAQGILPITDVKDPFYASVTPQVYATGAATVIAWMLVFMLLITPRTFFMGGASNVSGLLGRRGMISGSRGGASIIGVGTRPWLQKVAAFTVAASMTIATADTFRVAEQQYLTGFMDAEKLRSEVVNSTELKVSRIVSDIFIWLALVQTLIRLFPRHREKVLIKWIGFALIILDATFSILNTFIGNAGGRPRFPTDAIPALNYLFSLVLSMLYALWVVYYSICKRKYAFYHSYMWNLSLIAAFSIIAILTPVIFFVTDISDSQVAGWGDYFRWVGAAASSVIVWEWVERIEAVEREEKKDGILGREVFDGDELIEVMPAVDGSLRKRRFFRRTSKRSRSDDNDDDDEGNESGDLSVRSSREAPMHPAEGDATLLAIARRNLQQRRDRLSHQSAYNQRNAAISPPPLTAVSPVSRADTASASTVYTVRYHTMNIPMTPQPRATPLETINTSEGKSLSDVDIEKQEDFVVTPAQLPREQQVSEESSVADSSARTRWPQNPFKRKKTLPPEEVRKGQIITPIQGLRSVSPTPQTPHQPSHSYAKWDLKGRVGAFAAEQGEKWIEKRNRGKQEVDLPVTIIPAQPRGGRTWSPQVEIPTSTRHLDSLDRASIEPNDSSRTSQEAAGDDEHDVIHINQQYEVEEEDDDDDNGDDTDQASVASDARPPHHPSNHASSS